MSWIVYLVGSNVVAIIFTWIIASFIVRHNVLKEQALRDYQTKNTELWIDFIKNQGGSNE